MKPRLKSSRAARDLIKAHEAFAGQAVPRGRRWMVGFGHSAAAREGQTISRDDAELLLIYDVMQAEGAIDAAVGDDLPGPVRDALVSFACSIGPGAFKVSDVARLARDGRHLEAAAALETWVRAEEDGRLVVSERLVRRRAAEKALYLQGLQTPVPAPDPEPAAQPAPEPAPELASPAAKPRLGPLVDLELEFVDPPEPAGMVTEIAEPEGEPGEPVEEPAPDSVADAGEAAPEPEPAPQAAPEAKTGDEPTRAVMARMTAQMTDTLRVSVPAPDADAEPAPQTPPVPAGTRLGFSFLTTEMDHPAAQDEVETVAEPALEPSPELVTPAMSAGPVPVYGGAIAIAASETSPSPQPLPQIEPVSAERSDGPAPSAGFSGEVQAVGRPDDPGEDEDEVADTEELHPGVLTGAAPEPAPPAAAPVAAPEQKAAPAGGSNWVFAANLAAGVVLTGLGIWDILAQDANGAAAEFGWFGPVAAAMGVVLVIASGWMLISRRKPAAEAETGADD